jgi:hypothetical protein
MESGTSVQTFMSIHVSITSSPSCDSEGVKIQLHWHVEKSDEVILSVDCRATRVFHVWARKFICLLTRLGNVTVFRWQPNPLVSYQCFGDLITGMLQQVRTRNVITSRWFYWSQSFANTGVHFWSELCAETIDVLCWDHWQVSTRNLFRFPEERFPETI